MGDRNGANLNTCAGGEIANLFKKPQEIFASAVNLGEYKAAMRPDKTLVLGFVAGAYIALGRYSATHHKALICPDQSTRMCRAV